MASLPSSRRAYRRTDDHTPGTPKVRLLTEPLPLPLHPTSVLIKVHAVSLNYRDANIANGGNPWPVIPHGVPCNDAAGEVVAAGGSVTTLAADGVLADYLVFDEKKVCRLPAHLDWVGASIVPCAGVTAWAALKDVGFGTSVLIQGTGGVSMVALKLARAAGLGKFPSPPLLTVNYAKAQNWHEKVLEHTDGAGVDLVVEVGGTQSLVQSMKCTRRGGIISQVGYLSKQNVSRLAELLPLIIDRRVVLRGINAGSKQDMDDLCAALSAAQMQFDDIVDQVFQFEQADEAIERIWQGKQVGKLVIRL
ncbi:chaperonin 10-like protein [Macrophomina phaseolina]|uniref:Chaperonin 10-like protein n=1 Tax=Macrophomina phaseolina TaxID=35725 RepID=A0ABQ8GCB4_9PEZI|nr:chaperonin 10-like protein [Macrophomina phaseolina]